MANMCSSVLSSFSNSVPDSISRWILDTRTIDHIICDSLLFVHSTLVTSSHVSLPNGHRAQVATIGPVQLVEDLFCLMSYTFQALSLICCL